MGAPRPSSSITSMMFGACCQTDRSVFQPAGIWLAAQSESRPEGCCSAVILAAMAGRHGEYSLTKDSIAALDWRWRLDMLRFCLWLARLTSGDCFGSLSASLRKKSRVKDMGFQRPGDEVVVGKSVDCSSPKNATFDRQRAEKTTLPNRCWTETLSCQV